MFDLPPLWTPSKPAIIRSAEPIKRASFLPGMMPGFIAARTPPITTISFISSASEAVNDQILVFPAGIDAGDLIIYLDRGRQGVEIPDDDIPSGFTSLQTTTINASDAARMTVSYKIATGSEGGTNASPKINAAVTETKVCAVFRADQRIVAISSSVPNAQSTDFNPSSQTVLSSAGTGPLIVLGCYGCSNAINPRTFTPASDGEIAASTITYLKYKIYNSAPVDVSVDMDDEGSSCQLISLYVQPSSTF